MNAREFLVSQLEPVMPSTVKVEKYAREVDSPTRHSLLLVRIDDVAPHPSGIPGQRLYSFGLVLIPRKRATGSGDDELDNALEDVLHAIDEADDIVWTRAERGTYEDSTHPAYDVTVQVALTKEK
ncbi:hypothetical protein ACOCJ5_10305 [Knoellia sp. CPCC 206450]|uniref:hypothetical protein n=1 Tax=Knoellia tibetensis TaxID=3404798 RepID=UPI003B42F03D